MNLLSTDIKGFAERDGLLHIFSAYGVDVYRLSDWKHIMSASITATCGCVNDQGIFIGTAAGVYWLRHGLEGVGNSALTLVFHTDLPEGEISSNTVQGIAGHGNSLLVCTDAGADYYDDITASLTPVSYTDASGTNYPALDGTSIAYTVASGLHVLAAPSADWDSGDATVLTTASSPAILSNTVQGLAYGTDLFIATAAGISIYDGTSVTNLTSTQLGTVVDCQFVWPSSAATDTGGVVAYATSNGSDGGRFGIYNLTSAANETTTTGDCTSAWCDDDWQAGIYDGTLENYTAFAYLSPAPNAQDVKRSWSLYAEITDSLGGLSGAPTLTVDGSSVTVTTTAITNGYRLEYTPASASSYGQQHRAEISATDADSNSFSRAWSFRCTTEMPTATSAPPPNVVVLKDISFDTTEADETYGGVNVVWLDPITHPLIVDDDQAQAVGTVAVEDAVYHKHRRTLLVDSLDANSDAVAELQEGDIIAYTVSALSEAAKKAVVLAINQTITQDDGVQYQLLVEYYELVSL